MKDNKNARRLTADKRKINDLQIAFGNFFYPQTVISKLKKETAHAKTNFTIRLV